MQKAIRGLTTVNLRSLALLPHPDRFIGFLRNVEEAYLTQTHWPIKSIELSDLVEKEFAEPLFLPLGAVQSGSSPVGDIAVLAALTKKKCPKAIFEIGTFEGLSAVVFVKNAPPDVIMHTLDLPHGEEISRTERSFSAHSINKRYSSGTLIDAFGIRRQTNAYWGDSAIFDFEPFQSKIDIFFVDGAHTRDYVARDSCTAFECIADDGWVLWHDCFTPQVLKILKEIGESTKIFQIRGTTLAIAMGKPSFKLRSKYHQMAKRFNHE